MRRKTEIIMYDRDNFLIMAKGIKRPYLSRLCDVGINSHVRGIFGSTEGFLQQNIV